MLRLLKAWVCTLALLWTSSEPLWASGSSSTRRDNSTACLHYPGVRTKGENVRKCSGHAIWLDNYRGTGYEVLRALLPEHTEPADEKRCRTGLHRGRERGGATWVG